ncbi:MAG: hypothetical protein LW806_05890 [Planctomycetaceae bacterium]|nr:hypothetical protein [Planctomycetaceae bacterium]
MSTRTPRHRSASARTPAELTRECAASVSGIARGVAVVLLLGTLAGPMSGCSVAQPEARARALEVGRISGDLAEVDIVVELRNPGRDEIELVQYDYTLSAGDGARYGGRWAALRALPPGQTVEARIPAVLPASSVEGGRTWSASGTLRYRDPNSIVRILYEAGILKTEVGFGGSGSGATRVNAEASSTEAASKKASNTEAASKKASSTEAANTEAASTKASSTARAVGADSNGE